MAEEEWKRRKEWLKLREAYERLLEVLDTAEMIGLDELAGLPTSFYRRTLESTVEPRIRHQVGDIEEAKALINSMLISFEKGGLFDLVTQYTFTRSKAKELGKNCIIGIDYDEDEGIITAGVNYIKDGVEKTKREIYSCEDVDLQSCFTFFLKRLADKYTDCLFIFPTIRGVAVYDFTSGEIWYLDDVVKQQIKDIQALIR